MGIGRFAPGFLIILLLPAFGFAQIKKHPSVPADQECYECHGTQTQVWQDGKHGLMNVKCVVCHGSTEKNFVARPGVDKCAGCHGEKVKDVEGKLPVKARDCFLCHDPHMVTIRFHGKGGM